LRLKAELRASIVTKPLGVFWRREESLDESDNLLDPKAFAMALVAS
jgi:hypothetical protein